MLNHRIIRNLRWVRRFNFHCVNHQQSVAEHSFYTGMLAYDFGCVTRDETYGLKCARAAMEHDLEESVTSDIPFLIKRRIIDMKRVDQFARKRIGIDEQRWSKEVLDIVRLADVVEMKFFLEEERRSGNKSLLEIEQEAMFGIHHSAAPEACIQMARDMVELVKEKAITDALTHFWKVPSGYND